MFCLVRLTWRSLLYILFSKLDQVFFFVCLFLVSSWKLPSKTTHTQNKKISKSHCQKTNQTSPYWHPLDSDLSLFCVFVFDKNFPFFIISLSHIKTKKYFLFCFSQLKRKSIWLSKIFIFSGFRHHNFRSFYWYWWCFSDAHFIYSRRVESTNKKIFNKKKTKIFFLF